MFFCKRTPKNAHFYEDGLFWSTSTRMPPDIPLVSERVNTVIKQEYPKSRSYGAVVFCSGIPDRVVSKVRELFGVYFSNNEDAYAVLLEDDITIYSRSERGLIYGVMTLLGLAQEQYLRRGFFYEAPSVDIRGAKVYLPGRGNIEYYKKFIDFLVAFRMNTLMIEIGGAMEYRKHPEINEGWVDYCKFMYEYSGKTEYVREKIYGWKKNSIHIENGEGGFLTQDEVKEIVDYCAKRHIAVIPEAPSLSHCDYLLTRHPELRERRNDEYADTYCPSNDASYELLFDVLDEIIAVFQPKTLNIGHDECYTIGVCEKCRGKNPAELYAGDIIKIHGYLKEKGIQTMMWAEKLLDARLPNGLPCGGAHITRDYDNMETMEEIPALFPCRDLLPNDIIMQHWYWRLTNEDVFHDRGFPLAFGNFWPVEFSDWKRRTARGVLGALISNWSAVKQENLQRNNVLFNLAYANLMFWEDDYDIDLAPGLSKAAFEMLYAYNYADVRHGIRITHTTDYTLDYQMFYDGILIVPERYDIGFYKVTYTDKTELAIPLVYGMNISSSNLADGPVPRGRKLPEVAMTTLPTEMTVDGKRIMAYEITVETAPKPIHSVEYVPNRRINAHVDLYKIEVF